MKRFELKRTDLWFQIEFSEPNFRQFREMPQLFAALFDGFKPFGLTLSNMKFILGDGTLAQTCVQCFLLDQSAWIQIWADRAELRVNEVSEPSRRRELERAALTLLELLTKRTDASVARAYTYTVGLHGLVEAATPAEFVAGFTQNAPQNLGPLVGSGAVFYLGPDGDRLTGTLSVDLSALVADAIYVRSQIVTDASKVPAETLPKMFEAQMTAAIQSFGLSSESQSQ